MVKPGKTGLETFKIKRVMIDATGLILGRLASHVAKRLLMGEEVAVVNAEKVMISGSKRYSVETFRKNLETRTLGAQKRAPKHPRRPDTYVRRVIRGMMPGKKKNKGKIAYGKLKVYVGLPKTISKEPIQTIPEAGRNVQSSIAIGELMDIFGWKYQVDKTTKG